MPGYDDERLRIQQEEFERVLNVVDGALKAIEEDCTITDKTGKVLADARNALIYGQLGEHDTPGPVIWVVTEYKRLYEKTKNPILKKIYLADYVQAMQTLLSFQKVRVRLQSALQPRPRDPAERRRWRRTHIPETSL